MTPFIKNFVTVAGLLLLVAFAYYLFVLNDSTSLDTAEQELQQQLNIESSEFLIKLNEIRNVSFNTEILSDPRLESYVDSKPSSESFPVSRENPFAEAVPFSSVEALEDEEIE